MPTHNADQKAASARRGAAIGRLIDYISKTRHVGATSWSWSELDDAIRGRTPASNLARTPRFGQFMEVSGVSFYGSPGVHYGA